MANNEFVHIHLSGTEILEICKYIDEMGFECEISDYLPHAGSDEPPL